MSAHASLCTNVAQTISDFYDDLKENNASDNVVLLVFTEATGIPVSRKNWPKKAG